MAVDFFSDAEAFMEMEMRYGCVCPEQFRQAIVTILAGFRCDVDQEDPSLSCGSRLYWKFFDQFSYDQLQQDPQVYGAASIATGIFMDCHRLIPGAFVNLHQNQERRPAPGTMPPAIRRRIEQRPPKRDEL